MITAVVCALLTALLMEPWAAVIHRFAWHGPLWFVHRTHHRRSGSGWEANDALSLAHAPVAIALLLVGLCAGSPVLFGVGTGMTLYGAAYLVVHDGLVHGRLPVGRLAHLAWFARLRGAHVHHHQTNGPPYGLFSFARPVVETED